MKPAQENYGIRFTFSHQVTTNLREAAARFEVKGIQQSGLVWGQFLLHIPGCSLTPCAVPSRVTSPPTTAQRPSPKVHFLIYLAISLPADPGDDLFL